MSLIMKEIETEQELNEVLELCYGVLGQNHPEIYGYDAWRKRLEDGLQPLVYAKDSDQIVSAVLGRCENAESLIIGFVACDKAYRRQGITKRLMFYFEELARKMGYKYITLGSEADMFYESCGYKRIFQIHGQNVYQKVL